MIYSGWQRSYRSDFKKESSWVKEKVEFEASRAISKRKDRYVSLIAVNRDSFVEAKGRIEDTWEKRGDECIPFSK